MDLIGLYLQLHSNHQVKQQPTLLTVYF